MQHFGDRKDCFPARGIPHCLIFVHSSLSSRCFFLHLINYRWSSDSFIPFQTDRTFSFSFDKNKRVLQEIQQYKIDRLFWLRVLCNGTESKYCKWWLKEIAASFTQKETKFELMIKPNGILKKKPKGRNAIPASNYIEKSLWKYINESFQSDSPWIMKLP